MAYADLPPESWLSAGVSNVLQVDCDTCDAHCIIFEPTRHPDTLVVAVRGTVSAKDVLCDMDVIQSPLKGVRGLDVLVHAGFNRQFAALSQIADWRISNHLKHGGSLVCTGHSLGAGVAALFAVSYGVKYPGKVSYSGYGCPRQGNSNFSEMMASSTSMAVCVKNLRDPVCACIPPVCLPMLYERAGIQIGIGRDPFPDIPDPLNLGDHGIANYVANLGSVPSSRTGRSPLQRALAQLQRLFSRAFVKDVRTHLS